MRRLESPESARRQRCRRRGTENTLALLIVALLLPAVVFLVGRDEKRKREEPTPTGSTVPAVPAVSTTTNVPAGPASSAEPRP